MGKRDKRVDTYIANSAPFARPILNHVRELVHQGCPDAEETIKWGMPFFGLPDPDHILELVGKTSMGSLGQLTDLSDLPADRILIKYIKAAAKLNRKGVKVAQKSTVKKNLKCGILH